MITLTMSLRGESGAKDAAIHCMQWARTTCLFAHRLTVVRHGLSALAMTRLWSDGWYGMVVCASMITLTMSLRG
jgi:hypothetical protein